MATSEESGIFTRSGIVDGLSLAGAQDRAQSRTSGL